MRATAFLILIVFSSSTWLLAIEPELFRRGDANADGRVDISDPVSTLGTLFSGGPAFECDDATDANDDGQIDISDAVSSLLFLFLGGVEPPAPGLICGVDPSADALDCERFRPCGHEPPRPEPILLPADDCDEVVETLREQLIEAMELALDENLRWLTETRLHGGPCWLAAAEDAVGVPPPGESAGDGPSEFTETNNQVGGVDEADFVKTDGAYIYVAAAGRFEIIDSWPAAEAHKVASLEIDGEPKRLFVAGDRALVYASLGVIDSVPRRGGFPMPWADDSGDCTYGYDCDFTGDGRKLRASVFDIADRANPRLLREVEFSGSYLSSRRIGSRVWTAVVFPELIVPEVRYLPDELAPYFADYWFWCASPDLPYTDEELRAIFARLAGENRERIEEATIADFLPSVRDIDYSSGEPVVREDLLQDCESFWISQSRDGETLLSIVKLDLEEDAGEIGATTIVGRPGAVYADADSLYIASRHYAWQVPDWFFPDPIAQAEATSVHQFALIDGASGSAYIGSGLVEGRILNQFSMDEHEGHLRIATTTGHAPSPTAHSTLSVLENVSGQLQVIGEIDGIAPTEDIRSVRFDGTSGYIVTFKKTDPLFVLDLADPRAPRIAGELKIPGFSTYMHRLDGDHLLSIGYDADDQGNFAFFSGILLQIFDVSDPADPQLAHREVIGTRGSTSDAATDHLAFNFFRSRGLLGVPIVVCEQSSGGGSLGDRMTFSGLMVYRVGAASGFELLGGVPHEEPTGEGERYYCGNWWTQSNSQVKRSIFMDDQVYSISRSDLRVSALDDLEHPIVTIPFGD